MPPAKVEVARILAAFTVGQATLAEISAKDTFNPTIGDDGVLWLDLGDKGYYSLQAQPDGQLLRAPPPVLLDPEVGERGRVPEIGLLL